LRSGSFALLRVGAGEVWNVYAGGSQHRKIPIEINENDRAALSIFCMRLAPGCATPGGPTSTGLLLSTPE
jgi:hypothetical protein